MVMADEAKKKGTKAASTKGAGTKGAGTKAGSTKGAGTKSAGTGAKRTSPGKEGLKKVEQAVSAGAAQVGRQTRELGEAVQKRVEKDLAPLAEKAGKELGKARKTFGGFLKSTAKATRKSARILSIKSRISAKMREVARLHESMGERYYQGQKKGTTPVDLAGELRPLVAQIDRVLAEVAALEVEEKAVRKGP
jgi:hypothetical protein